MFRWGILSTAKIGREHLVPAIQASKNGVVTAIASRDGTRARHAAEIMGIEKAYGTYEALLADPEIDGVYIPLHTAAHVEWTIRAADAGKHVLCEKPISTHADQIESLIAARERNRVLISEAFMVTYHPQWLKVRELLAVGAIGRLRHIDGVFSYFNDDPNNMRNRPELGGGGLLDIGVYPTVTARFATGVEPKRLRSRVDYHPEFGTDIFANVDLEFLDFTMQFYISTQMAARQSMVFHGDQGSIALNAPFNADVFAAPSVTLWDRDHACARRFDFVGRNHYRLQCESFVEAARGQGAVFSLENSRANQRVIDAAFAAGKSGGWVAIKA